MFSYLRGSGEDTGWLSIRLSCGDSYERHIGDTLVYTHPWSNSIQGQRTELRNLPVYISLHSIGKTAVLAQERFVHTEIYGLYVREVKFQVKSHLYQNTWSLRRGEWDCLHEVRDVPLDKTIYIYIYISDS